MARLDEPLAINGMQIRNRLALASLTTCYGSEDGTVTEDILGFYRERARDVGLLVVEATAVGPNDRLTSRSLGLWTDAQIPGMARLAEAIRREGAAAIVQIDHAGARGASVGPDFPGVSPSGVPFHPEVEPAALSQEQIPELAERFASAAARAAAAGFDGVEVHGAHLYLIGQFLSPLTNRRGDRYGGDAAGRATMAAEVVRAIRARVGARFLILFRLNVAELDGSDHHQPDAVVAARMLEDAGVDAFHTAPTTTVTWEQTNGRRHLKVGRALLRDQPRGASVPFAAEVRRAVGVPVIAVGKLGDTHAAGNAVGEGLVDMVGIGRQMIADPHTAGKILAGRGQEIVQCEECMTCSASVARMVPLKCSVNRNPTGTPRYA